jgi:predicted Co/Zn/Cd cation transporter (cation efflux family)
VPVQADEARNERRALTASMVGAGVFAVVGIVLGIVSGSQVILFDGAFSLLGVGLAWMALLASRAGRGGPTPGYPYGREGVVPLVIGIEGVALLATCAYAAFEALSTILSGGGEVVGGWGLVYAAISFVAPLGMAAWLTRTSSSELVAAEATQWRAGGAFGAGMLAAFVGAQLLADSSRSDLAGYVDPGLVLVAACVFLVPPLRMVRTMLRELLEAAPDDAVQERVQSAIEAASVAHGLDAPVVRMTKVGTKLYVDAEYLVEPDRTIGETDDVRRALAGALTDLGLDAWLTVEFSADPSWDDPPPVR